MTTVEPSPPLAAPTVHGASMPFRRASIPALVRDIELSEALPTLRRDRTGAPPYRTAHLLVRSGGRPLGWVTLPFAAATICPGAIADAAALLRATPPARPESPISSRDHRDVAVSVVIATCGLTAELLATVRSALDNVHPIVEVIVVDNRPDGSAAPAALAAAFGDEPRVRYAAEPRRGSSHARNRGLEEACGDIVAFCDDDVLIDRYWVGALVAAFESDPAIACVTGLILPRELETEAQVLIEEYGGYSKGFVARVFDLDANRHDSILYPYAAGTFGSGANVAFRREALITLDGFDPNLGAGVLSRGGEDLDAQVRAVLAGYRLRYEPNAIVWHAHHRSMRDLRRLVRGYGIGLTAYIFKQMVTSRRARREIAQRIPAAVAFHFRGDSTKNANKHGDYPRELALLELAGMAYGPLAYMLTRVSRRVERSR